MESVKAALRVLELVAEHRGVGVSELARVTGDPKTTVQRQLTTLHEAGWITPLQQGARRRWVLSSKLPLIALKSDQFSTLRTAALPVMEKLREATRETVHLTVREDQHIILIERLDSPQTIRIVRAIGSRAPLHVAANGKAILAQMTTAEVDAYLARDLESWTDRTVSDPASIRGNLARISEAGYAFGDGELDLNVRTVAAAVTQEDGAPIGSISLSCPAFRLTDDLVEGYGNLVKDAAAEIGREVQAIDLQ